MNRRILMFMLMLVSQQVLVALPADSELARLLVGRWHEYRHDTRYNSDGTFTVDPDEWSGPTGTWRIEKGRLITNRRMIGETKETIDVEQIVSLDRRLLKVRILKPAGRDGFEPSKEIFILRRVSNKARQPRRAPIRH